MKSRVENSESISGTKDSLGKLSEEIEKAKFKIDFNIIEGSYVDQVNSIDGYYKFTREVKNQKITLDNKLNTILKLNIDLVDFRGKGKQIILRYGIKKIGNNFGIILFKSFGNGRMDKEIFFIEKGKK